MYNSSASLRASMRSLLLPSFSKAFFRGLHTTSSVTCGFSRSYNQPAQVPSSNVRCTSPPSPWINCRMVLALVSMTRSEEHTSELQSRSDLVCRLLLEKKKKKKQENTRRKKK